MSDITIGHHRIVTGDCIEGLDALKPESIDVWFSGLIPNTRTPTMRPLAILIPAWSALLAISAAVAPTYAASPPDDGVTIVPSVTVPAAAPASVEAVKLSDGDTIVAPGGTVITTTMDPKTGDFHTVVTVAGR